MQYSRVHCVNMFTYSINHQKEKRGKKNLKSHVSKGHRDGMRNMASILRQHSSLDARCRVIYGNTPLLPFSPSTHLPRISPRHLHAGVPGCLDCAVDCQAVSLQQLDKAWGAQLNVKNCVGCTS